MNPQQGQQFVGDSSSKGGTRSQFVRAVSVTSLDVSKDPSIVAQAQELPPGTDVGGSASPMTIRSGSKPASRPVQYWECPWCDKKFEQPTFLRKHALRRHAKIAPVDPGYYEKLLPAMLASAARLMPMVL